MQAPLRCCIRRLDTKRAAARERLQGGGGCAWYSDASAGCTPGAAMRYAVWCSSTARIQAASCAPRDAFACRPRRPRASATAGSTQPAAGTGNASKCFSRPTNSALHNQSSEPEQSTPPACAVKQNGMKGGAPLPWMSTSRLASVLVIRSAAREGWSAGGAAPAAATRRPPAARPRRAAAARARSC